MGLKEDSAKKLSEAYNEVIDDKNTITCKHSQFIDYVIDNTHLTYKYVLFTAILAKATDEKINTLCLQKQSTLPGAYDARTICHKVIVPFEMETLQKALGGSNEPFLNKPARFPELSTTNAVRKGNDRRILDSLCTNLPKIQTSDDAYSCLLYLLKKLIIRRDSQKKLTEFTVSSSTNTPAKLMNFINEAVIKSYEGETFTLVVAGVYHLLYNNENAKVEVHPVNQSGASGREISDLDIYLNSNLISSNELKDKDFAETDVRHAADKVLAASGYSMLFIVGPHSTTDYNSFKKQIEEEYLTKNFLLKIISWESFFSTIICNLPTMDCYEFIRYMLDTAHDTKFKEEVIKHIDELAQKHFELKR